MSNPMQMYLFVHDAIVAEVIDLEQVAREFNRENAQEVTALSGRVAWFQKLIKAHEKAEEDHLFPALEARYGKVAATYEFDHDHFEANYLDGITEALGALTDPVSGTDRKQAASRLHRQAIALNESMRLHVYKENELLLPIVANELDIESQVKLAAGMAGAFDPKLMAEAVSWMYGGQEFKERELMIRFLQHAFPEPAFGAISTILSGISPAEEWQQLRGLISGL